MTLVQFVVRIAAMSAVLACASQRGDPADLVLRDAMVYTMDGHRPRADAVAIDDGKVVYVGSNDSVQAFVGSETEVLRLGGRVVLPGFHDTHVHPVTGGIELGECDLNPAETLDSLRRIIAGCATRDRNATWVRGGGWGLPIFPAANPSRALLDSLVPDRPAYLSAADGHSAWVNSHALALAGITRATPDPASGRIERDASGGPSGTLRESAMNLVSSKLPAYVADDYFAGLERALAMAARFGITTVHEASATEPIALAYARADSLGKLTARVILSLHVNPRASVDSELTRLSTLRKRVTRGLVRADAAKIFMDGVIEAHTAALLEPYVDRPGHRGELNLPPAKFDSLVQKLDSAGFKVHVHAIGDRAIRVALDGFAKQHARDAGAGPKHIISHLELIDPSDIPRFAQLGVIPSFQPLWAYADKYITDLTEPKLGAKRSRWLYPIASVTKSGATLAAGSDWSVSSMNPLEAIQVAITRRGLSDSVGKSWISDELVDVPTMVRAYTIGGAIASDHDATVGTIIAGKAADLIVLSDDILLSPRHRIHRARVLLTLTGGRVAYRDSLLLPYPGVVRMECPKCRGALKSEMFQETEIDRCGTCGGIWFDMGEREALERIPGSEALDSKTNQDSEIDGKARVMCPRDKVQMTRMVDPARPTVWLESCPLCYGVFLDAGEFRQLKEDPSFWARLIRRRRHRPLT